MTVHPLDIIVLGGAIIVSVAILYYKIKHPPPKRLSPYERCLELNIGVKKVKIEGIKKEMVEASKLKRNNKK